MTPDAELPSGSVSWNALARYFAGEMSDAETAEIRQWIEAEPERQQQVARLRAAWGAAGRLRGEWDVEAALARMLPPEAPAAEPKRVLRLLVNAQTSPAGRAPWRRLGAWAAAAMIVLAAGLGLWQTGALGPGSAAEVAAAMSEVATPRGQRASLRLPDGTDVILGPESKLRYAVAYASGPRTVHLEGEAYFSVTHDAARPFTVHTAHAVATDLGTRFSVRAYAGDSGVTVAVTEGEVSLRHAAEPAQGDSVLLTPGDLGRVVPAGEVVAERGVPLDEYVDWATGRLVFRDTPLRDAVVQLGRWYDLDVRLADPSLGAKRVTARFKHEPADRALSLIAASLDLRVDARDTVVVLRAR